MRTLSIEFRISNLAGVSDLRSEEWSLSDLAHQAVSPAEIIMTSKDTDRGESHSRRNL